MTVNALLHARFEAFATSDPDRTALNVADLDITYGELGQLADQLARRLIDAGAGPEQVVAIHLDRSAEAIVAMLAVLKAGSAYLPLPVGYPVDRLTFMLADSGAQLMVTRSDLAETLAADVRVICVDRPHPAPPAGPPAGPPVEVAPSNTAYIIYTSGTTGTPKGVVVTHESAVNLVSPVQDYVRFGPDEVFLQLAPLAFDASAFEIWGALTNGAELVLAAPSYQAVEELPASLVKKGISVLLLTPAVFHVLMDRQPECFDGVRQLIVGGDAMSAAHAHAYVERKRSQGLPGHTLRNVYGPTEATTLVSSHVMDDVPPDAVALPLGRPIHGASVYLLDADLVPVTPGERGQIFIGGTAVARGYLHRPELTRERFVPDPFAADPAARMYATGDEGRLAPSGLIEFVGRLDRQVKVRGFRIELGEVEAAVRSHPGVLDVCVVVRRSAGGTEQLVAHVVTAADADLAEHVRTRLPEYMCPQRFVEHTALPLNASGKVDRTALSEVEAFTAERPGSADDRLSPVESVMAEIWCEVLGLDHIAPDADFFALGGDSLLAIRILSKADERGLSLQLVTFFRSPTLRGVCAALTLTGAAEELDPGRERFALIPPQDIARLPEGIEAAYPATRLQLGMIFESMLSDDAVYIDVVSRDVNLELVPERLREALDAVARRHPILRTRFDLADFTEPLQLVEATPALPLQVESYLGFDADRLAHRHEEVMAELTAAFDPEVAPLMRVHAAHLDSGRFRLTYSFNHAVLDGWSESVLALELLRTYHGLLTGDVPVLGKPAALAEFVKLERAALADERSLAHFERFRADVKDSSRRFPRHEKVSLDVPMELAHSLTANAKAWGVPLKSQFFAVCYATLCDLWDQPTPVVGMSVNGRPELPGADLTVGLFVNHVPIRLAETTTATWESLAHQAFAAENEVLEFRRFPYSEIRSVLGGPPFDVVFSYVHFHARDELLELGLVTADQEVRDRTNLPARVEVINDLQGRGLSLDITVDADRYGDGFASRLADSLLDGIRSLAAQDNRCSPTKSLASLTKGRS
ncbi:amino acid adenylation domain-containing protein [Kitasatospora sp. NPDC058162]|uniref:amino acid adenylation domain-containing protein n=1 Tax=Kitasatospora sp. NPDC058162 TaxID=3346362 RepID=UPI0036D9107A